MVAILETGCFLIICSSDSSHTLPGSLPPSCSSLAVTCWVSVTPNCSSASCLLRGVFRPQLTLARHTSNETCLPVRLRGEQDAGLDHHFPPGFDKVFKSSFLELEIYSLCHWNVSNKSGVLLLYSCSSWKQMNSSWPMGGGREGTHDSAKYIAHPSQGGGLRLTDIVQMSQNLCLWLQKKGMSSP